MVEVEGEGIGYVVVFVVGMVSKIMCESGLDSLAAVFRKALVRGEVDETLRYGVEEADVVRDRVVIKANAT